MTQYANFRLNFRPRFSRQSHANKCLVAKSGNKIFPKNIQNKSKKGEKKNRASQITPLKAPEESHPLRPPRDDPFGHVTSFACGAGDTFIVCRPAIASPSFH